ncbi:MAG: hypothetical protein HYT67_01565 [Candidatus Yanofskybacteria bacterium]|nr:hypothetical protein [Candidatus Yanofskybacteria bacterium]
MKTAFLSLVAIFVFNIFGLYFGWYLDYFWFDMTLHFLGGFFMAIFLSIYLKDHLLDNSKLKNTLIILGVVSFVGVTWEFAEYIANQTLIEPFYKYFGVKSYFMGDLADTVNDLTLDMLGAASFAWLHLLRRGKTAIKN